MDWHKLKTFHTVAVEGSFTRAGDLLGLSQSAVSRQIAALEDSLGTPLFHRHVRGLVPTEQGEVLYGAARQVVAALAMAEARLADAAAKPSGLLAVTTPVGFGTTWLTPRIGEFLTRYPDIHVRLLVVDDRELDLATREADVAIRMVPPTQPDLVQRHLMTVRTHIYGSREYLRRHGTPQGPGDLRQHRLIIYGEDVPGPSDTVNWLLNVGVAEGEKHSPTLEVNSVYGQFLAAESGLGLAGLPDYMAQGSKRLVQVLTGVEGPLYETYFVYPAALRNSTRLAIFRDFLIDKIAQSRF